MPRLDEALAQISDIRSHLARSETFRGYRSTIVGFSAVAAFTAAALQAWLIPDPSSAMEKYLVLWIGAAALSLVVAAVEMSVRCARALSPLSVRHTRLAVEQFLPCLVAGGLLTMAVVRYAAESAWMLPGLWSIVFSLGVFASWRLLPRPAFWVAVWYLAAGTVCLATARGGHALSPWAMAGTFGVGQTLAAAILYYTLERNHDAV
ncbi:MAG TPA: hypothetical protein VHC22_22005 [Pirellulales bacterium]|nr:hypothetical protein [Pirellulales bacterium]